MGQYFRAININRQEFISCYDYGCLAKLLEHSWLYNPFVTAVMCSMREGGSWYKGRLVWAGDYMEKGLFMKGIKGKTKQDETLYQCCREEQNDPHPCIRKVRPALPDGPMPEIIANFDRRQFVRLDQLPECYPDDPGWHLHPLPLLTCSGNGEGTGDYSGLNRYVGLWAGDTISAEYVLPVGFSELNPGFSE